MSRKIPDTWFQASPLATTMVFFDSESRRSTAKARRLLDGERRLGYFILPPFQRPLVWTIEQKIRFIESAWMRLPLGVFIWNEAPGTRFDMWLLDGQQRVSAILQYVSDGFPVFGHRFSELTEVDRRIWDLVVGFPCLRTNLRSMVQARDVYDRLAYGGTPHEPKS